MPGEHVALRVAGDESIAIRAERELPDVLTRPFQRDELLPSTSSPKLNGFVAVTTGSQPPVIVGKGQCLNRAFVGAEGADLVERGHGPDLDPAFFISGRQETPIR